jgi:cell division transport system ATP-binding protein
VDARPKEIVSLSHVDKVYIPKQTALRDINLKIDSGEFVFFTGSSGAGKSTLLKLLFAEERPSRGQVIVAGRNLNSINRRQIALLRRLVGVIFQDYRLLMTRTVLENVAFALEVVGISRRERHQLAFKMLAAVGLKERVHAMPAMLSGGEQQRVAIARALVNRPHLILADEPTGNLDPDLTRSIFNLLIEASECGSTVIVASHNLDLIKELNRRTVVLDKGKIIGDFAHART